MNPNSTGEPLQQWPIKRVAISELKPYERNPRKITPEAYQRLKSKIQRIGFNSPIIATHDMRIIGGHQRITILKELGVTEVSVCYAPYEMTEAQFKEAVIENNISDGRWDIELLEQDFEIIELSEYGVEDYVLRAVKPDITLDAQKEWKGMPEYATSNEMPYRTVRIHMKDQAAVDAFAQLLQQVITDKTKFAWYPELARDVLKDKAYVETGNAYSNVIAKLSGNS